LKYFNVKSSLGSAGASFQSFALRNQLIKLTADDFRHKFWLQFIQELQTHLLSPLFVFIS